MSNVKNETHISRKYLMAFYLASLDLHYSWDVPFLSYT